MKNDTLLFGIRPLIEAIDAGKEIDKVFIQKGLQGDSFKELFDLIRHHKIPFQYVPIHKLNRLTRKNHQGIVAYLSLVSYQPIEEIVASLFEIGKDPFIVVLDRLTDVRNIGAIARSAECAGAHAIVVPEKGSAQINADAMKASAGALTKLPVCRVKKLEATVDYLKESGLKIVAGTEKAKEFYSDADLSGPVALVMGSEEDGITPAILRESDTQVKIPIYGEIKSLNVSVAAGILLFEAAKQRSR